MKRTLQYGSQETFTVQRENVRGLLLKVDYTGKTNNQAVSPMELLENVRVSLKLTQGGFDGNITNHTLQEIALAWSPETIHDHVKGLTKLQTTAAASGTPESGVYLVSLEFPTPINLKNDERLTATISWRGGEFAAPSNMTISTIEAMGLQVGIPVVERVNISVEGNYDVMFSPQTFRVAVYKTGQNMAIDSMASTFDGDYIKLNSDKFNAEKEVLQYILDHKAKKRTYDVDKYPMMVYEGLPLNGARLEATVNGKPSLAIGRLIPNPNVARRYSILREKQAHENLGALHIN